MLKVFANNREITLCIPKTEIKANRVDKWYRFLPIYLCKANQSLGFLQRNIKPHKQETKSTAYKPSFDRSWNISPLFGLHTLLLTHTKLSRSNAGLPGGHVLTTGKPQVTKILENLNWRPLDQRRIDNRLVMMYKVTYDLVAIPASEYLIPNHREYKSIHPLAYKQIPTSTNYYEYSLFLPTIIHWNALPTCIVLLPTLA